MNSSREMGNSQQPQVFRPARSKFWLPLLIGLWLALIGALFLALPICVAPAQRGLPMLVVGISGAVMALVGVWLLWIAQGVWGAVVRIGNDGLELKTQQWSLWKPKRFSSARLPWNECLGVKLCEVDNFLMPGGIDENYILATTQGEFVVRTTLWGTQTRQIAELVASRIQQPILRPSHAPADVQRAESLLSPSDRLGIKLMRAFGWVCTILGWVLMVLIFIALLAAKPGERLALGKALIFTLIVLIGARSLRRFRIRMG
jgi:hypothetical protein